MTRPTPAMLAYLQRAVRHEFAAAQQFTLQAVVGRALGDTALQLECEGSAVEELCHAQRFAAALDQAATAAARLYRDAARARQGVEPLRRLFEFIGTVEETRCAELTRRLRQSGEPIESRGS